MELNHESVVTYGTFHGWLFPLGLHHHTTLIFGRIPEASCCESTRVSGRRPRWAQGRKIFRHIPFRIGLGLQLWEHALVKKIGELDIGVCISLSL